MRERMAIAGVLLVVLSCNTGGDADRRGSEPVSGKALYKTHCAICHGADGKKGLAGAEMIPDSDLSLDERITLITNGKGNMMPYRGVLSKEEIARVAAYTLTLD